MDNLIFDESSQKWFVGVKSNVHKFLVSGCLTTPLMPESRFIFNGFRVMDGQPCSCGCYYWFQLTWPDGVYYNLPKQQKVRQNFHFCAGCGAYRERAYADVACFRKSTEMQKARYLLSKREHCEICGIKAKLEIDHIKPVKYFIRLAYENPQQTPSLQQACNSLDNLQVLCKKCHSAKTQQER